MNYFKNCQQFLEPNSSNHKINTVQAKQVYAAGARAASLFCLFPFKDAARNIGVIFLLH